MMRRMRVLVVDDNSMNREIITEVLGEQYIIIEADDGHTAMQLAQRYRPRIVLLDVMLPELDGYEVCRSLRRMPTMASARIIMVTAKAMPSERARGLEAGADAYISKPFDDSELLAAIRPTTDSSPEGATEDSGWEQLEECLESKGAIL